MQPLKLNQKFLTLVNLCAPPDDVTRPKVLLHATIGVYVFLTLWSDLISSSFFLFQYKTRDLQDVLGSVLQIAAVSSNIFGMITVFLHAKSLRNIFYLFKKMYNECNFRYIIPISFQTKWKNTISEKINKILYKSHVLHFKRFKWWIISNIHQDQSALYKGHSNPGHKVCTWLLRVIRHTCGGQYYILLHQRWWWNRHSLPLYTI